MYYNPSEVFVCDSTCILMTLKASTKQHFVNTPSVQQHVCQTRLLPYRCMFLFGYLLIAAWRESARVCVLRVFLCVCVLSVVGE